MRLTILFWQPFGEQLPHAFIDFAASRHDIVLQTGQVANASNHGTPVLFEMHEREVEASSLLLERKGLQGELEVVRISLGIVNNFEDVWRFVEFVKELSKDETREKLWHHWIGGNGQEDTDASSVRSRVTFVTNASGGQVLL